MPPLRLRLLACALPAALALAAGSAHAQDAGAACRALTSIKSENSTVKATWVNTQAEFDRLTVQNTGDPEGPLFRGGQAGKMKAATPFCRVEITSSPAPGAEIKTEVWLPAADRWNRRFLAAGNGGAAGALNPTVLAGGLAEGFAVLHSDAGSHSRTRLGPGNTPIGMRFGQVNKEWATNYVHRGYHIANLVGKEAVQAFYQQKPEASYFMGCSAGGYEALSAAQRYPADYDGIIAGDPAIHFAQVGVWQGASYLATHKDPASTITPELLPVIYNHFVSRCDGIDGVRDGVISRPNQCKADFQPLRCKPGTTKDCLTDKQIAALDALYAPYRHPKTGKLIYPGFTVGAELAPAGRARILGENVGSTITANTPGAMAWLLPANFSEADWSKWDFAADTDRYLAAFAPYDNANPDISAFLARGGKLILYTGWADPNLSPRDTIGYFEDMQAKSDPKKASTRLFMAPGMYHCEGGPGPTNFGQNLGSSGDTQRPGQSILLALDNWVTKGVVPERIVATKYKDDDAAKGVLRTRPLCPYPKVEKWSGKGSTDDAANFTCAAAGK